MKGRGEAGDKGGGREQEEIEDRGGGFVLTRGRRGFEVGPPCGKRRPHG